ncbi:MAG: valine--tRNA ligase [Candidatus Sumerlaeia bacterium]
MTLQLDKRYDPSTVEQKWYQWWEEQGFFHADEDSPAPPYSIAIPPPNITGILHMGHALNNSLQDFLIRWKRASGFNACWVPGTDHASIATENKVVESLRAKGLDKRAVGRDKFLEAAWQWKAQYGGIIVSQLRRMGCSCDWARERFTLDEGLSRAVLTVFKRLFDEGLIYRDKYMVNWCPALRTALSDDEVVYEEKQSNLWYFRYPIKDVGGFIVVATTRPETMLGDTAVAVNPHDERYKHLVGKTAVLPLMNREIPIIADEYVDPEFGTGAVKITPAHDPNDFEIGKRRGLEFINILTPDGLINENAPGYTGLDRWTARRKVVADLEALGLIEKIEDYTHKVGHCYRTNDVIEPYISEQWFVRMRPLAEPAAQAVRDGRVRFVPKHWENTYFHWMDNVRDWCISRQLWWGHRIPVWYHKDDPSRYLCFIDESSAPPEFKAEPQAWVQDPDVLDTWFSSALWPFSTLGWPEKTRALEVFYPTSVLVTGHDIIFFWVARMIMMGLKFMGEVPFRDVYINAIIRDEHGKKMSKSLGNSIDPIDIISKYGADAMRFTLCAYSAQGRNINLSEKRIEGYRNFINKLWNAMRFTLTNTEDLSADELARGPDQNALLPDDRWILGRLGETILRCEKALQSYEFDAYATALYGFTWNELCDWYIEWAKPKLYRNADLLSEHGDLDVLRKNAQIILITVTETLLRLLQPVAPFVAEEIWQIIKDRYGTGVSAAAAETSPLTRGTCQALQSPSIMIAPWPARQEDAEALVRSAGESTAAISFLQQLIYCVRNLRGEMNISAGMKTDVLVGSENAERRRFVQNHAWYFKSLLPIESFSLSEHLTAQKFVSIAVVEDVQIGVPMPQALRDQERRRLEKELQQRLGDIDRLRAKLADEGFIAKAPPKVVERERDRLAQAEIEREQLESRLAKLQ